MSESLRALIVEDSPEDTELLLFRLRKEGYDVDFERVETAEQMSSCLGRRAWDVVIADYRLPKFSAMAALELLEGHGSRRSVHPRVRDDR